MGEYKPMLTPEGMERMKWILRTLFAFFFTGIGFWLFAATVKYFEKPLIILETFIIVCVSAMILLGIILTVLVALGTVAAFSHKKKKEVCHERGITENPRQSVSVG